jgi:S1-C subfamily serine protease
MLSTTAWATLLLTATTPVSVAPADGEQVYDRMVRSTTLILGKDGLGSGVLVHRARRLVVTNDHVVEGSPDRLLVAFALYDSAGDLVTDFAKYREFTNKLRQAQGPPAYIRKADVLARKPGKDLALLQLDSVPDSARSLRLSAKPAATGSRVFTVGNSGAGGSNMLWRYTTGNVRGRSNQTVRLHGGDRPKHIDSLVMETDAPINPGDSGGPVVNDKCHLVAVNCFGNAGGARLVSGHIDVDEVRKFLRTEVPDIDWP